jgi:hypothetical protein
MGPVTIDELRAFANRLDGQTLATRSRHRPFSLRVTPQGLEYTPESTGKRRRQLWRFAERCLERYNEKRSLHPADYHDISINASYFLAVLGEYLTEGAAAIPG